MCISVIYTSSIRMIHLHLFSVFQSILTCPLGKKWDSIKPASKFGRQDLKMLHTLSTVWCFTGCLYMLKHLPSSSIFRILFFFSVYSNHQEKWVEIRVVGPSLTQHNMWTVLSALSTDNSWGVNIWSDAHSWSCFLVFCWTKPVCPSPCTLTLSPIHS